MPGEPRASGLGDLALNVFRPLIIHDFLQSCRLLADGMDSFREHCVAGLTPNLPRITQHVQESLMLVTALAPHLGYEKAAQIAGKAHREGTTLRAAALATGFLTAAEFDAWVSAEKMVGPR